MNKRLAKRHKRENRESKKNSWYCAGCKARHPLNHRCPVPRLRAQGFNRVSSEVPYEATET